jgi:protoheme IX farnesyltransferase
MEIVSARYAAMWPLNAYVSLAKPKAIFAHFITASAAMFLAAGGMPPASLLLLTLLGGGCAAASANALNCVLDRDIDALMLRTRGRPLPSGLIKPGHALIFAAVMGLAGISILGVLVSPPAAALAATALAYYVLAYTFWLRRRTYWSAIIGSAIGAFPPIIGWVVVTSRIALAPFLLSGIVILWTVPHFWSLALFRGDDYARAGLRTLPSRGAGVWILVCSTLLAAVSLLLVPAAGMGPVYTVTACLSGAGLLLLAAGVNRREPARAARRLYSYSIVYITALFGAIIIDAMMRHP